MKVARYFVFCLVGIGMLMADAVQAQQGKWGVGGFVDYNLPMSQLRKRWGNEAKYGGSLIYVSSPRTTIEIEYNRTVADNGKPASQAFVYGVDHQSYTSPNGVSKITFNNLVVNALLFVGEENQTHGFKARDYRYYVLVGGGIYRYKAVNKDLVYPAQTTDPINLSLVMDPQIDQRYTLGANIGAGVEGFVTENLSIDLRARYNFVVGELRPMLYYGLERVRPLQMFDVGVGMKFYFWR